MTKKGATSWTSSGSGQQCDASRGISPPLLLLLLPLREHSQANYLLAKAPRLRHTRLVLRVVYRCHRAQGTSDRISLFASAPLAGSAAQTNVQIRCNRITPTRSDADIAQGMLHPLCCKK